MARLIVALIPRGADPAQLATGTPEQLQWEAARTNVGNGDYAVAYVPILDTGEPVPRTPAVVSTS
ncbi:MAG: hypothetical protein IT495_17045 [Gammaproteobacteria bacterium]|nr:hypothetical protein [Gammaproteobacteria bacterium]